MRNLKIKIALCEKGKKENKEKENIEEKIFNYQNYLF